MRQLWVLASINPRTVPWGDPYIDSVEPASPVGPWVEEGLWQLGMVEPTSARGFFNYCVVEEPVCLRLRLIASQGLLVPRLDVLSPSRWKAVTFQVGSMSKDVAQHAIFYASQEAAASMVYWTRLSVVLTDEGDLKVQDAILYRVVE